MAGDFAREIWGVLSKVDCSKHIEKKHGLTYLSWMWAWAALMEEYPASSFEMGANEIHSDGTVTVRVTVTVQRGADRVARTMWLPVLDARNKAIANPCSFDINRSRMRCLTKCIAMFGLGHYIYAGEDVPSGQDDDEAQAPAVPASDQAARPQVSVTSEAARLGIQWDSPDGGLRALIRKETGIDCTSIADAGRKLGSDARQKVLAALYLVGMKRDEAAANTEDGLAP